MLESSLATAHATIKTLQAQLPEGVGDNKLVQQVCNLLILSNVVSIGTIFSSCYKCSDFSTLEDKNKNR